MNYLEDLKGDFFSLPLLETQLLSQSAVFVQISPPPPFFFPVVLKHAATCVGEEVKVSAAGFLQKLNNDFLHLSTPVRLNHAV